MPAYLKILVYVAASLAAGAAAAPPVFWAGQGLAGSGVTEWLAGFPFHRVLSRCLQISFVAFLWPAVRWIGLRRLSGLGLGANPLAGRDLLAGLLLATGSVALVSGACLFADFFSWRDQPAVGAMGRIVLTAGFVSVLEEIVFRGVVLGVCLWNLSAPAAIAVSSALFALVHFLKPAKSLLAPEGVHWFSGYAEIASFGAALPSPAVLFYGLASLFVAGWILGRAAVRTRSLWLPIGLHAGWVLAVQTSNLFLRSSGAETTGFLPWVGPALVSGAVPTGLLPLAGLLLTGWMVRRYLQHVPRSVVA